MRLLSMESNFSMAASSLNKGKERDREPTDQETETATSLNKFDESTMVGFCCEIDNTVNFSVNDSWHNDGSLRNFAFNYVKFCGERPLT